MAVRWRWLTTWWFLASVALLGLNDHVLKARYGTWWTGKLSDVAGPVVVATLLAVLAGRRTGVLTTAVAFTLLKTVPGVAEAAAPLLGGITRRDPTDLIGLLALVPAWRLMGRIAAAGVPDPEPGNALEPARSDWDRRAQAIAAAFVALLFTTATSPPPEPAKVTDLTVHGDAVYARVQLGEYEYDLDSDDPYRRWYRSADGGFTWTRADEPTSPAVIRSSEQTCLSDGTCFRADGTAVLQRSPDGRWRRAYGLNWDQRALVDHRREPDGTPLDELFGWAVTVPTERGEHVVVIAHDEGVVLRDPDGTWHRRGVGPTRPTDLSGTILLYRLGQILLPAGLLIGLGRTVAAVTDRPPPTSKARLWSAAAGGMVVWSGLVVVSLWLFIWMVIGYPEPVAVGLFLIGVGLAAFVVPPALAQRTLAAGDVPPLTATKRRRPHQPPDPPAPSTPPSATHDPPAP